MMCKYETEVRDPSDFRQSCICGNSPESKPYGAWECMRCGRIWKVATRISDPLVPIPESDSWALFDPTEPGKRQLPEKFPKS